MELEDFREGWNQPQQTAKEFSRSQLKATSMIDNLVKAQIIQFGKVLLISLGALIMGAVFLGSSQTEGYLPIFVLMISCVVLTIPFYLTFQRTIKMIKSLDVSAGVANSLRNYRHRIEAEIKIQKLMMLFVIVMLLGFAFIVPSIFASGFEVASAVGIYALILLIYSYRNFEGNLKKVLTKLSHQLNSLKDDNFASQ